MEAFSYGDFLRLLIRYPMDMAEIYVKHIVSLMTPFYRQVYISDSFTSKEIVIVPAVLVWFFCAVGIITKYAGRLKETLVCKNVLLLAIAFSCLMTIPGTTECRFFLSIYFFAYFYLYCGMDLGICLKKSKKYLWEIVLALGIVGLLWASICGDILAMAGGRTVFLIGDTGKTIEVVNELSSVSKVTIMNSNGNIYAENFSDAAGFKPQNDTACRISFDLDCENMPELFYFDV